MPAPAYDPLDSAFALHQAGNYSEALSRYDTLIANQPGHAEAFHLSGLLLYQIGDSENAAARIARAIELDSTNPGFWYNYGVVLQESGHEGEAEAAYRETIALDATNPSPWVNLGNLLADQGRLGESANCHRNALHLQPESAEHHIRLARALRLAGEIEAALASLGQALVLDPENELAHSTLLFTSQYQPGITAAELYRRHRAWADRFPAASNLHELDSADSSAPFRVGFLSPDLGNHPVGIFLAPLLERLKAEPGIVTLCFHDRKKHDEYTARIRSATDDWQEIDHLDDASLEKLLRGSRLDILIELAGHTDNNRLPLLSRKPAPIQITWAGYVGTTGLEAIDYLITDAFQSPDGSEEHHAETLLRFPCNYVPYEPPAYAPEVSPLPLLANGYPTFGCFNNPTKLTDATLELWARLLRALPEARLVLKYKGMDDWAVQNRVRGWLRILGIESHRIDMLGGTNHGQHLAAFALVDVALDPLPYSGGLSSCEALWMGVPVVTLPGDTFASRHSFSHLSNAGLSDTIARDEEEYLALAQRLVSDPALLARRREEQRGRMAASPLCDLDAFKEDFLSALETVTGRQLRS